ncbi:uncharacterized protein LOC131627319 [Vicia villosa]|uniref:uncharacterized protein LOC131627319 n=1 Tax=Vicia villosa TaxID=3911 RepID=UPI00273B8831|nr:uncharacterized protein LOC131627319 [Vicia villosa]
MRAIPLSTEAFLFPQPSHTSIIPITHSSTLLSSHPFHFNKTLSTTPRSFTSKTTPSFYPASKSNNPITLDDDDSENLLVSEDNKVQELDSLVEDGVFIEVTKLEKNSRRIESRISIEASLDSVWNILTDYERLADFIPGLALSKLIQKSPNFARLLQIGEQSLAFGLKFDAKGVIDCFEKELVTLPSGMKRDIDFKMIEGDFQLFEGKWSISQLFISGSDESPIREISTTLTYIVDVKPKMWLPVGLIEGRLCKEIKKNLIAVRGEAQKATDRTMDVNQFG